MDIKPPFVEGIYLMIPPPIEDGAPVYDPATGRVCYLTDDGGVTTDDAVCWACMTETEYETAAAVIYFDTECDHWIYCVCCDRPIDHALTDRGVGYERMSRVGR